MSLEKRQPFEERVGRGIIICTIRPDTEADPERGESASTATQSRIGIREWGHVSMRMYSVSASLISY